MVEIGKLSEKSWKFEWEIHDFFSYSNTESSYRSPYFCVSDEKWNIHLLPVGKPNILEQYFSLHLCRWNKYKTPMAFEFTIGIKTVNNTIDCELSGSSTFDNGGWGWAHFIWRSKLLLSKSELVPSGILTIICFVKVKHNAPDPESSIRDLAKDFKDLLISEANSDVTFYVKEDKCLAHRTILAARSPVFAAMFRNDTIERKTGVVKISDSDPKAFRIFLSFLYTGEVHFKECNICDLYKISDKYNVSKLKLMCVDFMPEHLSVDNFCEMLILSHQFEENGLQVHIQNFFNKNFENIVSSDNWELFTEDNFRLANSLLKSMAPKVKIIE